MFSHLVQHYNKLISSSQLFSGLAPLFFRLILGPVMIIAGFNKLNLSNEELDFFARLSADANVVAWFGNTEWGLGLPFPELLAFLAGWSEFFRWDFIVAGLNDACGGHTAYDHHVSGCNHSAYGQWLVCYYPYKPRYQRG